MIIAGQSRGTCRRLSDPERSTLAEIGKRLGRKALRQVACVAKPDTILGWYRRLIARKFDGSKHRCYPGRPRTAPELEALVVRIARGEFREFIEHFHTERNHQGKSNVLLFPSDVATRRLHNRAMFCRERLGGLLKYYLRCRLNSLTRRG